MHKRLERVATRRYDRKRVVGPELARSLGEIAWECGRNLGALVDRAGHVTKLVVGDRQGVRGLPSLGQPPAPGRLRGLRFVRTELQGKRPLCDEDRGFCLSARLDAFVRLVLDDLGEVLFVEVATLDPARVNDPEGSSLPLLAEAPRRRLSEIGDDWLAELEALEEELSRRALGLATEGAGDRALLVGLAPEDASEVQARIVELAELTRSALYSVVATSYQRRRKPDPRTLIGRGKVRELSKLALRHAAQTLVFDRELSGVQLRNLEEETGLTVLDRTELVLRIFERRARTRAAKLRVALARERYELPRLVQRDHGLSRIARGALGGAGTRGKGEPRLELARRRMRERIRRLEKLLGRVALQQHTRRLSRERAGLPLCALVGYTNAGKTSWLNALTGATEFAEDLCFATLDTRVRKTRLEGGLPVLVSDTVGFLRELPEGLRDAFRSTLEEICLADLCVHVVDISAPDWEEREASVLETLGELGAAGIPRLTLYNKADLVDREAFTPIAFARGAELVSVHARADRLRMRSAVEKRCQAARHPVR